MSTDEFSTFRLGLVGAGRMGMTHLDALAGSRAVTVVGIADPNHDVRKAVAVTGYPIYSDLGSLLDAGGVDGVLIAAPTDLHVDLVEQIVAAGVPALCEKPCGLTVAEVERCARAAAGAGVLLHVAYWRRFVAELVELRDRIVAGELGDILAVNCYQWDEAPPSEEFRSRSGGIFVDMGVHEFDQIRWITGQEFVNMGVVTSHLSEPVDDPDCGQLVARLDGGATALVSLGRWHPDGDTCKVEVYGTKGTAESVFLRPSDGDEVFAAALRLQAEDFARSVLGGSGSGATVADAVAALSLAETAAARASQTKPA
jgi:myo-inositol 2-dehydrogenase / D-chiro-inositol 1-dehydrogenase